MHEVSVARAIVEAAAERAGDAPVLAVTLEIGTLSCIMPEALRFCFDVVAADTVLEGAALTIIPVPGRSRCRDCGAAVAMQSLLARCECGSTNLEPPQDGDALRLKSIELATAPNTGAYPAACSSIPRL